MVRGFASLTASEGATSSVESLRRRLSGRGGLTHQQHDAANSRLTGLVLERLQARAAELLSLPDEVTFQASGNTPVRESNPQGYRAAGATSATHWPRTSSPVSVRRDSWFTVWSATAESPLGDFVATSSAIPQQLEVLVRDLVPQESEVLRTKVDNWISAILDAELARLDHELHEALVQAGYLTEWRRVTARPASWASDMPSGR